MYTHDEVITSMVSCRADGDPLNYYDEEHDYIAILAMSPATLLLPKGVSSNTAPPPLVLPISSIHFVMLLIGTTSLASCGWTVLVLLQH